MKANTPTWQPGENAQPVDQAPCTTCDEVARRDEKLIDALQDAMVALTAVDGIDDWRIRSARAKASILEAMRLMQAKGWR